MHQTYRFAEFELRPAQRLLLRHGQPQSLGARAFDVLVALVERQGQSEPVTKEALLQIAWHGLVVEEANLQVQVSQLRKVIGHEAIATISGLGYRFALALQTDLSGHNLPMMRTGFIGREVALADAERVMRTTRLLTLIGIGGTGKTRLALMLAERLAAGYAHGAWWVDLSPLDDAEQIALAVANTLGCPMHGKRAAPDALCAHLRQRTLLLVLDNCEHLLDGTAALVDLLLSSAPGLCVLATSREALSLPGESVLPVRPLELPSVIAPLEDILRAEAVRLFVQRAQQPLLGFTLDAATGPVVAKICRRVDGIPLAIELAAAQLRVVTPVQMLDVLQCHFNDLTGQRRALPRQQTMSAVIGWSWARLKAPEQQVLKALALCPGGCDFDAAAALLGPTMSQVILLNALSRLVDTSLITVQQRCDEPRYFLLETVRQFAMERMHGDPLAVSVRERHVLHYLALAEAHDAQILRHGDAAATRARIDLERENILRAIDICDQDGSDDAQQRSLRMVAALRHYWTSRGLNALGLKLTLSALHRAEGQPVTPSYRLALLSAAWMENHAGQFGRGLELAADCKSRAEAAGDLESVVEAHRGMGISHRALQRLDDAKFHHRTAVRLARTLGSEMVLADALQSLSITLTRWGHLQEAADLAKTILTMRRRTPHGDYRLVEALHNAARTDCELGKAPQARAHLSESLSLLPRVGSLLLDIAQVELAARLATVEQAWQPAVVLKSAAVSLAKAAGIGSDFSEETSGQELLTRARQALDGPTYDAAWSVGSAMQLSRAIRFSIDREDGAEAAR